MKHNIGLDPMILGPLTIAPFFRSMRMKYGVDPRGISINITPGFCREDRSSTTDKTIQHTPSQEGQQ